VEALVSRRFLDDVRADLTGLLVDNVSGNIEASDLLPLLIDLSDSTIEDESAITGPSVGILVNTAVAWAPIGLVYTGETGGDVDFLKLDQAAGTVQGSSTPGYTYSVTGFVSYTDGQANRQVDLAVLRDGAPVGFIARTAGRGNGRPLTASFAHLNLSSDADAVYQIGIQTPEGVNSIELLDIALGLTIRPTNNP
jgi:hypothetical protein